MRRAESGAASRRWLLLAACAVALSAGAAEPLMEAAARDLFVRWTGPLDAQLAAAGGDPVVLVRQPLLRSPQQLRPARIVFGVFDAGADVAGRDGWDLNGLLLDAPRALAPGWVLFIVGAVERRDGRPAALAEVRVLARRDDAPVWRIGPADEAAVAMLAAARDPSAALRFPAERDRFRAEACAPWLCVRELGSGAVWHVRLDEPAAAEP